MKTSILSVIFITLLGIPFISGCATNVGPEYRGSTYEQIKRFSVGEVIAVRPVVIKDSGAGTFIGALVGAVVGSTMGGGRGTTLMTLGGGLAGAYAGSQIAKANAQELTVRLDNKEQIVIVVKGDNLYLVGDRIKIIKDGNRVAGVERISPVR